MGRRTRRFGFYSAIGAAVCALAIPAVASAGSDARMQRIINGNDVSTTDSTGRWSALVGLTYQGGAAYCGGTLVEPTVVVTAAHCVTSDGATLSIPASDVYVMTGRRDQYADIGQLIPATSISFHPDYDASKTLNDVAVIKLSTPSAASPMRIVQEGEDGMWGNGAGVPEAWIAGWGNTIPGDSGSSPAVVRETTVPIKSDAECAAAESSGGLATAFVPSMMICGSVLGNATVEGGGRDTCQGDSGGPLLVGDGAGGYRLAGITSWGYSCASSTYGVYTRIANYRAWIGEAIAGRTPTGSSADPTPTRPGKPTLLSRGKKKLVFTWAASTDDVGVSSYYIYMRVKKNGKTKWKALGSLTEPGAELTHLKRRTKYVIRVRAKDSDGNWSAFSKSATFKTR